MGCVKEVDGFEWDDNKDHENVGEHKLDFRTACKIWMGTVLDGPDDREDYGEDRYIAYGAIDNRIIVVVYTWRGDRRRIISARKATSYERQAYYSALEAQGCSEDPE